METMDLQAVGEDVDNNGGDQSGGTGDSMTMMDPDGSKELENGERSRGVDGCTSMRARGAGAPGARGGALVALLLGLLLVLRRSSLG
jgi:hypothetical protein